MLLVQLSLSVLWTVVVSGQEPPTSIEIGVEVTSHESQVEDNEFMILVDTWWKILAWSLAVLLLSCLCCYFSRYEFGLFRPFGLWTWCYESFL